MRDFIYGSIDGIVTTFAIVAGAAGAGLSHQIIFVMGCANLLADAFSMAVSNYEGTKAEKEHAERLKKMEEERIAEVPEGERLEIKEIFRQKGFQGEKLEELVNIITSNKQVWIEVMLTEEHGVNLYYGSPLKAALMTFLAFCMLGILPIFPYLVSMLTGYDQHLFIVSSMLTALGFFTIGAVKGKLVKRFWLFAGFTTFLMGSAAAGISYFVGYILAKLTGL